MTTPARAVELTKMLNDFLYKYAGRDSINKNLDPFFGAYAITFDSNSITLDEKETNKIFAAFSRGIILGVQFMLEHPELIPELQSGR